MLVVRRALRDGVLPAAAALAAAVAGWLFVRSGSFTLTRIVSPDIASHLDFDTFWRSSVALLHGADIYETGAVYPNLNTPALAVLLAPLGWLEVFAAYRLMVLVTLALVVASMAAVARELRLRPVAAVLATAAVLVSSPLLGTLGLGQVYGFLAAGLTICWIAGRRGHGGTEAVALGVVIALKPSLALLLLLPLVRRRWRAAAVAAGVAALVSVAGVLVAGHAAFLTWLGLVTGKPTETYFDNASLPATILRLTTVNDWARPVLEMPAAAALTVGYLLAAGIVGVTLWRASRTGPGPDASAALWAVTAASLLTSPLTWHNYLILLAPGVLVVIADRRRAVAALLLALPLIGMEWPPLWDRAGTASAVPLSLYCAILLTYWVAFLGSVGAPGTQPGAGRRTAGSSRNGTGP
jgi:hypothetical protein